MARLDKDEYYLEIARAVTMRSTCLRIHYGAVLVYYDENGEHDRIISTGYNGAAAGLTQCTDTGRCIRMEMNVPHGYRYELCRAVHAEANAIAKASGQTIGTTLYLYGVDAQTGERLNYSAPCDMCKRDILNAGIKCIIAYKDGKIHYTDPASWKEEDDKKYAELLEEYSRSTTKQSTQTSQTSAPELKVVKPLKDAIGIYKGLHDINEGIRKQFETDVVNNAETKCFSNLEKNE